MTRLATLRTLWLTAAMTLLVGLGLAAAPMTIDCSAVPFGESPLLTPVGLGWNGGLVLTFGDGDLGTAKIPGCGAEAYDSPLLRSGLVEDLRTGYAFVLESSDLRGLRDAYLVRLMELGLDVGVDPDPRIVHAGQGDLAYRLVFGYDDGNSVRVYIGL